MKIIYKMTIVATLMALMIVLATIGASMTGAAATTTGPGCGWNGCYNPKVKYGLSGSSNSVDISCIHHAGSVLPWPVVKYVTPNPAKSGQVKVKFEIAVEYPFPGTTANIADTLPSGFVLTGPFYLDGKAITPSKKTSSYVAFNKVPSPSYLSPTGVRRIVFYATAPKVKVVTTGWDTATAQFYYCRYPYGPSFYYMISVQTKP
jgi:hypothetical protein